ncbi:MAG: hypothetical protein JWM20_902 [Patescibacteria group bacterium]|nr:hypothetical protein [Patescibacteria group bacterium]
MYSAKQKFWTIFLAYLCYKIEKKVQNLEDVKYVLPIWNELGPKIMEQWLNSGDIFPEHHHQTYLHFNYGGTYNGTIFGKVFGEKLEEAYGQHVISPGMRDVSIKFETDIAPFPEREKNLYENLRLEIREDDRVTQFSENGGFAAYYDIPHMTTVMTESKKEAFREGCKTSFNDDFMDFFEKNIGLEFEKALIFFCDVIPRRLKQEVPA